MKNNHLVKVGGIVAIVGFLFLPIAGCGDMTLKGMDLFGSGDVSLIVKILAGLAMAGALLVIITKSRTISFMGSILGIACLLVAYFIAKKEMGSDDELGISEAIKLKSGSYVSILGFILAAFVSRSKKELLTNEAEEKPKES
jgi:hypothetical protein